MKLEQLWQSLINLTEMWNRAKQWKVAQTDSTLRSNMASYEQVTQDDVNREIKRIEQEVPEFGVIFLPDHGVFGLYPKR